MLQKYKIFEWHTRDDNLIDWGTDDDAIVLPMTHIDAVMNLLHDDGKINKQILRTPPLTNVAPSAPVIGEMWYDTN